MHTYEGGLWLAVEKRMGRGMGEPEKELARLQGLVDEYGAAASGDAREQVVERVARLCDNVRRAGFGSRERIDPKELLADGGFDEHQQTWELWADLEDEYTKRKGWSAQPRWEPFAFSQRIRIGGLLSRNVVLEFDDRLPKTVVRLIVDRLWDQLEMRRTRPLQDKARRLLRLVCLEVPQDLSWESRMESWNERYPDDQFSDKRMFESALRRAEEQLCGHRHGLEILYDSASFAVAQLLSQEEVDRVLMRKDPMARRMQRVIRRIEVEEREAWRDYVESMGAGHALSTDEEES